MSKWNDPKYSDEDLAEILSDRYADIYSFSFCMRGEPREALVSALDSIDNARKTVEYRLNKVFE